MPFNYISEGQPNRKPNNLGASIWNAKLETSVTQKFRHFGVFWNIRKQTFPSPHKCHTVSPVQRRLDRASTYYHKPTDICWQAALIKSAPSHLNASLVRDHVSLEKRMVQRHTNSCNSSTGEISPEQTADNGKQHCTHSSHTTLLGWFTKQRYATRPPPLAEMTFSCVVYHLWFWASPRGSDGRRISNNYTWRTEEP